MKKLNFLVLLAGIAFMVSCNKSDDPKPNEIVIDDIGYDLVNGYTEDWGTSCWGGVAREEGCTVTHSVTGVLISDASMTSCWPEEYVAVLELGLYSPGEDGLTAGTYEIVNSEPSGDQTGNSFGWLYAEWYVGETYYYSQSAHGTVKVSGSFPNLTFKYDIDFIAYTPTRQEGSTEVSVSGQFKGTFEEASICD